MKPNQTQDPIERMLETFAPQPGARLEQHLANAPWTRRAVARRRLRITSTLAALALLLAAALTPTGRALAQSLLRYFTRAESKTITMPAADYELVTAPEQADPSAVQPQDSPSACGTLNAPRCTLAEAQEQVDFPIRALNVSDTRLRFSGATLTQMDGVLLSYQGEQGVLNLTQVPAVRDDLSQWVVGPQTVVESAAVGSELAEYVRGGWYGLNLKKEGTLNWEEETALQTLRWQAGGMQYTLWFASAKTASSQPALGKNDLVALAETLTNGGTAAPPVLSVAQAAEQAGFVVSQPASLPPGFQFSQARYASAFNAVCIEYRYHTEDLYPAAVLVQSNWALPGLTEIQTQAVYNGDPVEISVDLQTLTLRGAQGGTASLVTTGLEPSRVCGGGPTYANRALLWQADGMNYLLFAFVDQLDGRGFLSQQEMLRLAEELNGAAPAAVTSADPERLISLEQAKSITGLDARAPALMLSGYHLSHVAIVHFGPYSGAEGEARLAQLYIGQPLGDGRDYKVLVMQTFQPNASLENLALAGGFEPLQVNGQPGLYQQDCWDTSALDGTRGCRQYLVWFEDGVQVDIETLLPASLPKANLIAIAESLR